MTGSKLLTGLVLCPTQVGEGGREGKGERERGREGENVKKSKQSMHMYSLLFYITNVYVTIIIHTVLTFSLLH